MLEVEMKFPIADLAPLEKQLNQLGADAGTSSIEVDHYFNAPDRDFAKTDEALRIRQIGERNFLTYKGPKLDAQTKTRTELEIPLGDGEAVAAQIRNLLMALGYRPAGTIRKQRRTGHLNYSGIPVEICLDQVDGVGTYVELETIVPDQELDSARRQIQALAQKLGLANSERRSYLELWLEKHRLSHAT
jgi:adenylate cyclase class 2